MSQPQPEYTATVKPVVKRRRRANSVDEPSKRQRATRQQQQQQQTADFSDVGNALVPIDTDTNVQQSVGSGSVSTDSVIAALQQEVTSLRSLVQQQQLTITNLESRLDNFFAAFGISSSSVPSSTKPLAAASKAAAGPVGDVASDTAASQKTTYKTYVDVARSVQEAVLAAVYVDQAATDRRASSFIVSGLPTSSAILTNLWILICAAEK